MKSKAYLKLLALILVFIRINSRKFEYEIEIKGRSEREMFAEWLKSIIVYFCFLVVVMLVPGNSSEDFQTERVPVR